MPRESNLTCVKDLAEQLSFRRSEIPSPLKTGGDSPPLPLSIAFCLIPHPKKSDTGGEDFIAISKDRHLICLADGVGGWKKKAGSANGGLYSQHLCSNFIRIYEEKKVRGQLSQSVSGGGWTGRKKVSEVWLVDALEEAIKETKVLGSCTFTAAYFNRETSTISGINVGDSGYMIIEADGGKKGAKTNQKYKVSFKSPVSENKMFNGRQKFNSPIQCGLNLPIPKNVKVFSTKVSADNLVVMASDGLWDNVFQD